MRLILIGAPGSGKSTLARRISALTKIPHLEADKIFWSGEDLRSKLGQLTDSENWILEGHLSKHHDITFPKAHCFLVIRGNPKIFLFRALRRDIFSPKKFFFNLKNHRQLEEKRNALIRDLEEKRAGPIFFLDNLSHPMESELKALAETLKSSSSKL